MKRFLILLLSVLTALSSIALFGCGKEPFTVTFNGNGGVLKEGEEVQTVKSADDIKTPKYEKEGYTFDGWDVAVSKIDKDTTVKAQWKANKYTITFDACGGIVEQNSMIVEYGENVGDLPIPTLEGYAFSGWHKNNVDGELFESGTTWERKEDITLYATWVENAYSIIYNVDGGTILDKDYKKIFTVDDETFSLPSIEKLGYKFLGWQEVGQTEYTTEIPHGSTGNKSFKAIWQIILYNIEYDFDGGQSLDSYITNYTIITETFSLPIPQKEGYRFMGWTSNGKDLISSITKGSYGNKQIKAFFVEDVVYTVHFITSCDVKFRDLDGKTVLKSCCGYFNDSWNNFDKQVRAGDLLPFATLYKIDGNEQDDEITFDCWTCGDNSVGGKKLTIDNIFCKENLKDVEGLEVTLQAKYRKLWVGPY